MELDDYIDKISSIKGFKEVFGQDDDIILSKLNKAWEESIKMDKEKCWNREKVLYDGALDLELNVQICKDMLGVMIDSMKKNREGVEKRIITQVFEVYCKGVGIDSTDENNPFVKHIRDMCDKGYLDIVARDLNLDEMGRMFDILHTVECKKPDIHFEPFKPQLEPVDDYNHMLSIIGAVGSARIDWGELIRICHDITDPDLIVIDSLSCVGSSKQCIDNASHFITGKSRPFSNLMIDTVGAGRTDYSRIMEICREMLDPDTVVTPGEMAKSITTNQLHNSVVYFDELEFWRKDSDIADKENAGDKPCNRKERREQKYKTRRKGKKSKLRRK